MSCCNPNNQSEKNNFSNQKFDKKFISTAEYSHQSKGKPGLEKMILLTGGDFLMGTEDSDANKEDREGPVRNESVNPFYIDSTPVTNAEFSEFVKDTQYKTEAEQYGWSFVFHLLISEETRRNIQELPMQTPWWRVVPSANWFQPEGPDSSIEDRMDHPVVHVSWNDAQAYCSWAQKRLLTEKEWEYAARGGLEQKRYAWGDELMPEGKHMCNIWQGEFPAMNNAEDGYIGTSPVDAFPPNEYGLYSMAGNVWEWCQNNFDWDLENKDHSTKAVRGGSYLCHESYCNRYRVAARTFNTVDSSTGNMGFRCARDY